MPGAIATSGLVTRAPVGSIYQVSGDVGVAAPDIDTITAPESGKFNFVRIINTHATQNLLVSWDGGTTWTTIKPAHPPYDRFIHQETFLLKGSDAVTTYDVDGDYYVP